MLTSSTYLAEELDGSMVKIPAGKSIFGLRDSQRDELAARSGVHWDMLRFHAGYRETEVDEFWMDRHPVTRGQFRRFLAETGYKMPMMPVPMRNGAANGCRPRWNGRRHGGVVTDVFSRGATNGWKVLPIAIRAISA